MEPSDRRDVTSFRRGFTYPLQHMRIALAPLTRNREASGFALDSQGLDEPVGWALAAASFLPLGSISDEFENAKAEAEAVGALYNDFNNFSARLQLENSLVIPQSQTKVGEPIVQQVWDEDVSRWWLDVVDNDGSFSSLACAQKDIQQLLSLQGDVGSTIVVLYRYTAYACLGTASRHQQFCATTT